VNINLDTAKELAKRFIDQASADYSALASAVQAGSSKAS
jgi:hypothetical protein